jgi:putative oxidoreductase
MRIIRVCFTVLARFFISLIFLSGALNTILHWNETEGLLLNILAEWQAHVSFWEWLQDGFGVIIPFSPLLLIIATVFQFFGALSILLGFKEKWGASLLICFLVPVTIIMHQFWFIEGPARDVQMMHFFKNLAILGGVILIALQGTESSKSSFPMKF